MRAGGCGGCTGRRRDAADPSPPPSSSSLRRRGLKPVDAAAAAADAASPDGLWLVVGLGNPGKKYDGTRHNVGFAAVDALASLAGASIDRAQGKAAVGRGVLGGSRVLLAKPQTYMNLSGDAVHALSTFYKVPATRLILLYDDMDTAVGAVRVKSTGGHGGHNGVRSVLARLGTGAPFVRVRIGVGRPDAAAVVDHVLSRFKPGEADAVDAAVRDAAAAARAVVELGVEKALSGCRV